MQATGHDASDGKARRAAQAQTTRNALIKTARALFLERGYHLTSTEDIVAASGVGTRGALYHHFADKKALFEAVFISVEEDLIAGSAASRSPSVDAFGQLERALLGFLDSSLNQPVQRILLIDGPAVLGWGRWRELESQYGLGAIGALLQRAEAEGSIAANQPLEVLSHILLAAVDEAALFVANSANPPRARDEAARVMSLLLHGVTRRTRT
jgi:AcrR family transcriptional regulator